MIIEPAPTGRACCRLCWRLIPKGSTRLTVYGYNPASYHLECVSNELEKCNFTLIPSIAHPRLTTN